MTNSHSWPGVHAVAHTHGTGRTAQDPQAATLKWDPGFKVPILERSGPYHRELDTAGAGNCFPCTRKHGHSPGRREFADRLATGAATNLTENADGVWSATWAAQLSIGPVPVPAVWMAYPRNEKHGKPAVLDLLHPQLGNCVRVIRQTKWVEPARACSEPTPDASSVASSSASLGAFLAASSMAPSGVSSASCPSPPARACARLLSRHH